VNDTIFYSRLVMYLLVMAVFGYLGFGLLEMNRWLVIAILALQAATIGALIWFRFRRR
jgi:hypothetical protein